MISYMVVGVIHFLWTFGGNGLGAHLHQNVALG
jgi:hypothetical protein